MNKEKLKEMEKELFEMFKKEKEPLTQGKILQVILDVRKIIYEE